MDNSKEITEIKVKAQFIGEFPNWETWIANVSACGRKYGIAQQLLHIDVNGFSTSGFKLRNTTRENVYPVKTYLLVSDTEVKEPNAFQSNSVYK